MYRLRVQAYSTYKGLFHWLNLPAYLSNVFIGPIIQVLIFSILARLAVGPENAPSLVLGISVQLMASILIGGLTQSYANETQFKTLSFLYISRGNRLLNYFSRPILHFPNALFVFVTCMLTSWGLLNINFASVNWVAFISAILVIDFSVCAFGQFLAVFAFISRDWIYASSVSNGVFLALTGAVIPISVFPHGLQEFARLLPITNGLFAVRETFIGSTFNEISGSLVHELIIGLGYTILGAITFLLFEWLIKRTGTLSLEE